MIISTFIFKDIIINFLIFSSSIFLLIKFTFLKFVNLQSRFIIFFYHTIFMILMIFYGYSNPGDSNFYWKSIDNYNFEILISSGFMKLILYFFKYIIHISYSNLILILNLIGTFGILFFMDFLKSKLFNKNLVFIILLFPSLHLWTNTFIKETFILTLLFLFIWVETHKKNYHFFGILFLLLIFLLRPYLGIILIFPFILKIYLNSEKKIFLTLPLSFLLFFLIGFLYFYFDFYTLISVDSYNPIKIINDILNQYNTIIHGSSIIYTDKFFIFNMIAYLFSPIFYFEYILSPLGLIFTLECIVLVFILFYLIKNFDFKFPFFKIFYLLSILLLLFIYAESTTNVGIVLRQKWTIIVFLIYILTDGQKKASKENINNII